MSYDVVTLGETMLRLTPPQFQRLEQAANFDVHVGGSESNVAVGLQRLGLNVAWLSRLTANPAGYLIRNHLRAHGVDVSHVVWTDEDRVGLYFLEEGKAPRGSQVVYDRAHSAMSRIQPSDLPESLFQPGQARLLHLSGITSALSESAAATNLHAAALAQAAGWTISFDLNYRARLWEPEQAVQACEPPAQMADVLLMPLRDAVLLYGAPEEGQQALAHLRARFPRAVLVLTAGVQGSVGLSAEDAFVQQPVIAAEAVGRRLRLLGSGHLGRLHQLLQLAADLHDLLRHAALGRGPRA